MKATDKIQKRAEVKNYLKEHYSITTLENIGDIFFIEGGCGSVLDDIVWRIKKDLEIENLSLFYYYQDKRLSICNKYGVTFCGTEEQASALHEAFGGSLLWSHNGWAIEGLEEKIPADDVINVLF